jgi:hypothetical protein
MLLAAEEVLHMLQVMVVILAAAAPVVEYQHFQLLRGMELQILEEVLAEQILEEEVLLVVPESSSSHILHKYSKNDIRWDLGHSEIQLLVL